MLKHESDKLVNDMRQIVRKMLQQARVDGCCQFCEVPQGLQHLESCYVWPLVKWRNDFNALQDPSQSEFGV